MGRKEDSFISQMLNETMEVSSTETASTSNVVNLRDYFESKSNTSEDKLDLNEFLRSKLLPVNGLEYIPETQCFRLSFVGDVLDFPSNWSIFSKMLQSEFVNLSRRNDADHLCDVLSSLYGSDVEVVIFRDHSHFRWVWFEEDKLYLKEEFLSMIRSRILDTKKAA